MEYQILIKESNVIDNSQSITIIQGLAKGMAINPSVKSQGIATCKPELSFLKTVVTYYTNCN